MSHGTTLISWLHTIGLGPSILCLTRIAPRASTSRRSLRSVHASYGADYRRYHRHGGHGSHVCQEVQSSWLEVGIRVVFPTPRSAVLFSKVRSTILLSQFSQSQDDSECIWLEHGRSWYGFIILMLPSLSTAVTDVTTSLP